MVQRQTVRTPGNAQARKHAGGQHPQLIMVQPQGLHTQARKCPRGQRGQLIMVQSQGTHEAQALKHPGG